MTGKPQVKMAELWERESASGNRYFMGYLGGSTLLLFLDGERPHPKGPDETIVVWNLILQGRDQAPRQQSPTGTAERGQKAWDRSRDRERAHFERSKARQAGEPVLAAAPVDRTFRCRDNSEAPASWVDDSEAAICALVEGPGR